MLEIMQLFLADALFKLVTDPIEQFLDTTGMLIVGGAIITIIVVIELINGAIEAAIITTISAILLFLSVTAVNVV
jgi:hypothetical protein